MRAKFIFANEDFHHTAVAMGKGQQAMVDPFRLVLVSGIIDPLLSLNAMYY